VVAGNNSYALVDPTAAAATAVAIGTNPPAAGDFRLGITFTDSGHVIGAQGSSLYRYTTLTGTTATLSGSPTIPDPAGAANDRLMSFAIVGGQALLAIASIGTDGHVAIFDVTNPAAPVFLASGNNTTGSLTANGGGTGQLAWNITGPDTAILYSMSTNQGIQAFTVTVPEPAGLTLLGLAAAAMLSRRRSTSN
jgi:MYXO-CTERM domain-containing protein